MAPPTSGVVVTAMFSREKKYSPPATPPRRAILSSFRTTKRSAGPAAAHQAGLRRASSSWDSATTSGTPRTATTRADSLATFESLWHGEISRLSSSVRNSGENRRDKLISQAPPHGLYGFLLATVTTDLSSRTILSDHHLPSM
jgi:hypothetical protein